jgi:uncharacterized protein (DUF1778 family)
VINVGTMCLLGGYNMRSRKEDFLKLRVEDDEKRAFQAAAVLSGLSLSAWTRERLRRAARVDLESAGQQIPFIKHPKESNK